MKSLLGGLTAKTKNDAMKGRAVELSTGSSQRQSASDRAWSKEKRADLKQPFHFTDVLFVDQEQNHMVVGFNHHVIVSY